MMRPGAPRPASTPGRKVTASAYAGGGPHHALEPHMPRTFATVRGGSAMKLRIQCVRTHWRSGFMTLRRGGWAAWLASHVDGVDAGGVDGDLDPGLAGLVVGAQVGLILGAELVGERVVVVRRDLGVAADLQVAIGDGQVEDEHGRGRVRAQGPR